MFEMFRAARWGVLPVPPRGHASIIHVEDLSRLLLASATGGEDAWSRAIFEPDDGQPGGWEHGELARAIGLAMGRKVWAPALPGLALKSAARLDRLVRGDKARLTPDRARYMLHPDWTSHAQYAVPAALWEPRIATDVGMAQTAAWYRSMGWL